MLCHRLANVEIRLAQHFYYAAQLPYPQPNIAATRLFCHDADTVRSAACSPHCGIGACADQQPIDFCRADA